MAFIPFEEVLSLVLNHSDLVQHIRGVCSLLRVNKAVRGATAGELQGKLTLKLRIRHIRHAQRLSRWLAAHGLLLRAIDLRLPYDLYTAAAVERVLAWGLRQALGAKATAAGPNAHIKTFQLESYSQSPVSSSLALVDLLPCDSLTRLCVCPTTSVATFAPQQELLQLDSAHHGSATGASISNAAVAAAAEEQQGMALQTYPSSSCSSASSWEGPYSRDSSSLTLQRCPTSRSSSRTSRSWSSSIAHLTSLKELLISAPAPETGATPLDPSVYLPVLPALVHLTKLHLLEVPAAAAAASGAAAPGPGAGAGAALPAALTGTGSQNSQQQQHLVLPPGLRELSFGFGCGQLHAGLPQPHEQQGEDVQQHLQQQQDEQQQQQQEQGHQQGGPWVPGGLGALGELEHNHNNPLQQPNPQQQQQQQGQGNGQQQQQQEQQQGQAQVEQQLQPLHLGHLTSLTKLTLGNVSAILIRIKAAAAANGGGGVAPLTAAALAPQLLPGSVLPVQLKELHLVACASLEPLRSLKHLQVFADRYGWV